MADKIKKKTTAVILTLALVISLMPGMAVDVQADSGTASISLVTASTFTFSNAAVGYGTQPLYSVRVDNTGTVDTDTLTIALSGDNPEGFSLLTTTLEGITVGSSRNFNIKPADGLGTGTYKAMVTVSGNNVTSQSFNVSFTVDPVGTTYDATIRTTKDMIAADIGNVDLKDGSATTTLTKAETGVYNASVGNGSYFVYINGTNTGRTITISGGNNSVTLDYFTVNFSASYDGTATECNVNATAGGSPISSGDIVLGDTALNFTATGTGAGSYSYAWSGTQSGSAATLTISSLNSAVNVACLVTGSGTPLAEPDYKINENGYNWAGSNQNIVLSGVNDSLTIYKKPSAEIKIEVQSEDGSTITINGNSVLCEDTRIIVSNDITLNLDNLVITAPTNWSAVQLNSAGSAGTMTLNITGICSLSGEGFGNGIYSDHDQDVVIRGSGTLNTTGGGGVSGSDGGKGIMTTSSLDGGSLTIEGNVTINAVGGSSLTHSGGSGIAVAGGDILIKGGDITATSGTTEGTNYNSSQGITASFFSSNHNIGGNIIVEGGKVKAVGGNVKNVSGGYGIYAFNTLSIKNGSVTAIGGNSENGPGGAGALAYEKNLEVSGGTLNVTGGDSEKDYGGQGIYNFYKDILISGGTITTKGGNSTNKDGGRGLVVSGTGKLQITGGSLTTTGGNGRVNGAHAVYVNLGTINVNNGANITAVGGNGTTGIGGVGLRAIKYDGTTAHGNTVTIANNAGNVYVRGGQGASGQRASIMGKDVYVGTGNIGTIVMEGSNPRSIKNTIGGENVYLTEVKTDPATEITISANVSASSSNYTYRAPTKADGVANMWLPAGSQTVSASGYKNGTGSITADDATKCSITLAQESNNGSSGSGESGGSNTGSGGGGGSKSNQGSSKTTNTVVEVNGQRQDAGEAKTTVSDGKTVTTITVDNTKLDKILETKGSNPVVTLPAKTSSGVVIGELNGQTVKNMENKEAVLEIKTENISYTLPASQINIDRISEQVGKQIALKDIKVSVKIAEPDASTVKVVQDTANKDNYQIVVKPVSFEITCTSGNKTVDVSKFNGYVERMIAIPDGVDPSKITTGIVLNADGTFSHVPTVVTIINGKYYAKINSLSNSTYSVIYNKMDFNDVKTHWAKTSINNMGSRLVVAGDGNGAYRPNSDMTRAEFATIIGKALGLKRQDSKSVFSDVKATDWYNGYTMTAVTYGIVTGYNSSTFGPNDKITREQAMTMIARAMKITELQPTLKESDVNSLLGVYKDAEAVSSYAEAPIGECLKAGLVSGKADKILAPKDYITRAEVAVIVERLLQNSNLIEK